MHEDWEGENYKQLIPPKTAVNVLSASEYPYAGML